MGLIVLAIAVHGVRALFPVTPRGDLLYHAGLAHAILRGEFPPGGPYEGLPAYYPPGFHVLLAGTMALLRLDAVAADTLLTFLWLPILPLTTFLLARLLTGRSWVAVLAVALTLFGGGYDLRPDRLWVNSLFLVGQEAYPLFPRDIVFALLPLAAYAWLRGLRAAVQPAGAMRALAWTVGAGLLLGLCALVQLQLLLPIPFAFATVAAGVGWRQPGSRPLVVGLLVVLGALSAAVVAPWFLGQLEAIRRNGGVALESSEALLPARFGFWAYARQFGLFLPFALVGSGAALLFLRRPDGPRAAGEPVGRWRPTFPEAPLLLLPWFALPFLLAVLYDPSWPFEDALRPQRLWLISSQPAAILAAIGLVAAVESLRPGRRWRPRLAAPLLVGAILVASVPTTVATLRVLFDTWFLPIYAHLDLVEDRVPDFAALVGEPGPRRVLLTYEDWSSLAWYQTAAWVVAVKPPGYAKLAYDPAIFTGRAQGDRRRDVAAAFSGDGAALARTADAYRADRILLARRDAAWGLVDRTAAVVLANDPAAASGAAAHVEGNGWDAVELGAGNRLALGELPADTPLQLEVRLQGERQNRPAPARRLRLIGLAPDGSKRELAALVAPPSGIELWQVLPATVTLAPGERLAVEALDPLVLQSVRGFVPGAVPPPGWKVARETPEAVLLERAP
ncbi:MAG TPA: hypothetical protein VFK38_07940 [Candidatus Limnocylindrales bacterium]|nr:hypothetical protein [Candidatus Limnocylindrales bacterium]